MMFTALLVSMFLAQPATTEVVTLAKETNPLTIAQKGAQLIGGAIYCKADPEDIESFSGQIEGLINAKSRDTADAVIARLEFKNLLTANRTREPKDGCQLQLARFKESLRTSR